MCHAFLRYFMCSFFFNSFHNIMKYAYYFHYLHHPHFMTEETSDSLMFSQSVSDRLDFQPRQSSFRARAVNCHCILLPKEPDVQWEENVLWNQVRVYFHYFQAGCSWASYLTSWSLNFLICKMSIIIV